MHKLLNYVCDELDELEQKSEKDGKLSMTEIQYADVLAHLKKNLLTAEEKMEEQGGSYYREGRGGSNRGSYYEDGGSYYERRGRGRNASRDSMGRYNEGSYREGSYRDGSMMRRGGSYREGGKEEFTENLRALMQEAPDVETKQSIQRMLQQMEQ